MPRKPKTPGFVITAAVLLFIYGSLMLICSFCGIAQMVMVAAAPGPQGPPGPGDFLGQERELAKRIPSYAAVEACVHVFNLALGVTMIAAGFGALGLKPFARLVGSGAAAADLVMTLAHGVYAAVVVFPVNNRIIEEQMPNAVNIGDFTEGISWASLAFTFLLTLVFCIPIIAFLNAKKSRDAFAGKFELDPHEERLAKLDVFNDEDDDYRRPRPTPPKAPGDTGITDKPD
jgi:hypothetical protein